MRRLAWLAGLALLIPACMHAAPERVRDLNADGIYLFQQGSYPQARETFEAALALQPEDPLLLYNLGRCHEAQGKLDRAESVYRRCLRVSPDHVECRHSLVKLLVQTNRRPEADQMVQEWLKSRPDRAAPYVEHAYLLTSDNNLLDARGRLQQAVTVEPHDPRALRQLGRLYEKMGYPDRAVLLYERSLEMNPHQPDLAQQASLLRSQGAERPRPE